ncbi:DUF2027 domain-containing protein [Prevotella scopos JCM 17725]|jgi:hypothetical protein|uniref:Smr domain-containing protein n=1 Tax=Prevotella scopos JCM 17725 TaxID=1236518 RepID=A0AAX2F254_9BACT|nr:DUF2027 domain-containing protein [Prevotella scopos]ANR74258.1 DNA mismatch repair protein [Prevotella scopos JCM 17725]QUB44852.1 DUF2027 domain-containing protein [Prevotella scopos JCM 17725]SHF59582.1 Smr domain-containing protein [Prevotella scopos JCM 17725]
MKIGDKVRFLSSTGGGIIAGFKGKIVLVEDEDGFQIPTPVNEVVIVEDAASDRAKLRIDQQQRKMEKGDDNRSIKQRLTSNNTDGDEVGDDWRDVDSTILPDDDPSTNFEAPVKERVGGDELSVYLAFIPTDIKTLTTTHFKSYLVNDSNYYVHFSYSLKQDEKWVLKAVNELEPNTKLLIEDFTLADLNEMLYGCVQLHSYKKDKPFMLKPTCDLKVKIDAVKFYKLNTFHESVFFEHPALVYTLVEKDKPAQHPMLEPLTRKTEEDAEKLKTGYSSPSRITKEDIDKKTDELAKRYKFERTKSAKQILSDNKIIIDLHADELLETTAGMTAGDILEYQLDVFRRTLDQYKDQHGKKLIFIHGKGEGVLRRAIIHELNYKYKHYSYQDASFREYGYGATQVTIK